MTRLFNIFLHALFGCLGGIFYYFLEILWRGYSHWTMIILGGVCFVLVGLLDEIQHKPPPIWLQMLQGAIIVTVLEFITGCVLNLWLGLDVWDYSNVLFNVLGQICLPFTFLWFLISYPVIKLENLFHKIFEKFKG